MINDLLNNHRHVVFSFLENFAIFSREQEHTQKESGEKNSDGTSDLVSYVEFQKNYRWMKDD